MTQKIDGKAIAAALKEDIKQTVAHLTEQTSQKPCLAVILVGEDPASQVYVRNKVKMAGACGMESKSYHLPADTDRDTLIPLIERLNADPEVSGILVQLPLPKQLDETDITQRILPEKDVDGLHIENSGKLLAGIKGGMVPCTPLGCLMLLQKMNVPLEGAHAVIIGRSNLFGKPMAQLLLQQNATVTMAHSRTQNLPNLTRQADIVIAAVGVPHLVQADWVKEGVTVIDVGITRQLNEETGKAKLVGDVDYDAIFPKAFAITPVPGGVGPMTMACLFRNTVTAFCQQHNLPDPWDQ